MSITIPILYQHFLQHPQVFTDTRHPIAGGLFFALKGPSFDANKFAAGALEAGAAYAVIDDASYAVGCQYLLVPDVLEALQQLALYHRRKMGTKIVALTGSNGKTTTKELMAAVLQTEKKIIATIGNLNNHIGVPLTLLRLRSHTEIGIIEMGANHQGEIAAYCSYTEPDFGLITNMGKAHLEGFGGIEGVKKGKGELFDYLKQHQGHLFVFADSEAILDSAAGYTSRSSYGSCPEAEVSGQAMPAETMLTIQLQKPAKISIPTHLVGGYNLPNALAAIAVGLYFGIGIDNIRAALQGYKPENSRSQQLKIGSNTLILDAYNANPSSMGLAINHFEQMEAAHKVLILGGMRELGESSKAEHEQIYKKITDSNIDNIYLVGPEWVGIAPQPYENSDLLCAYLSSHPISNSTILLKGSRGSRMERVLPAFDLKKNNENDKK